MFWMSLRDTQSLAGTACANSKTTANHCENRRANDCPIVKGLTEMPTVSSERVVQSLDISGEAKASNHSTRMPNETVRLDCRTFCYILLHFAPKSGRANSIISHHADLLPLIESC